MVDIAAGAFENCKNLKSVKLSKNTKDIGMFAFWGTAITSIEIPNSVIYIHDDAFRNTQLSGELYIPDSVISIYPGAFLDTQITEVSIPKNCQYGGAFPPGCNVIIRE